jgi:hypothetical protein
VPTIPTPVTVAKPRRRYRPREPDILQRLFRKSFPAFTAFYKKQYIASCGRYRLPLIQQAADAFRVCGDWKQGIARVHRQDCEYDFFGPFLYKSFYLCSSCSQMRTLLFSEYLSEDLLLKLPHRQFVWTIPKCLRVFLKHDRYLHAELSRLIFHLLSAYFTEAAGRKITPGVVSRLQAFGVYASWKPHWQTIVLE